MPPPPLTRLLFTDIDGTIVHYPEARADWGAPVAGASGGDGGADVGGGDRVAWVDKVCATWAMACARVAQGARLAPTDRPSPLQATGATHPLLLLPPSTTGKRGAISLKTLALLSDAGKGGTAVVVLSGARTTTLSARLAFLPSALAVASENGGRLWWLDQDRPTLVPLREDAAWRDRHAAAAGPRENDCAAPADREGPLWDAYRALQAAGWSPDASGYATAFRLPVKPPHTEADARAALASLPPCLASTFNLGCADVYPATSGKRAVAEHVALRLGIRLADAAFLCDDDNDLDLAAAVGRAFAVGATHASVAAAVEAAPARWWVAENGGTLAADAAVEAALAWLARPAAAGAGSAAAGWGPARARARA